MVLVVFTHDVLLRSNLSAAGSHRQSVRGTSIRLPRCRANLIHFAADEGDGRVHLAHVVGDVAPFFDGDAVEADVGGPLLNSDNVIGTVFEGLRDATLFSRAGIYLGTVSWPGEIDLAPDAMYDEIRGNGVWVVN